MWKFVSTRRESMVSGLITIGLGAFIILRASSYRVGSLQNMGPGYFPILLGVIMCLLGLGLFVTATEDPPVGDSGIRVALRGPVLIIMAILAFALTVQPLGLVPSVFVAVFLSSQASRGIRVLDTLILAAVTTAVTFLIFRVGLGLQIEAFGS